MESETSPQKKIKSPVLDAVTINSKTSVTCTNVPESLLEASAAKKHFSKFGRVVKIRLFIKKHMCIIEYDQPNSAERAVLNAGAYDGFMFDVTRSKPKIRRRSKKDDDPDWVPDSDVEEELNAMGGVPIYRLNRKKTMDLELTQEVSPKPKIVKRVAKQSPIRKRVGREKQNVAQPASGIGSPVPMPSTNALLSTLEAAAELHQLRFKVSMTPDEQWRTLDARDRILRAWGGAGSRVKVGGATIGTCPDMCPEKERLHRQAEHQVMTLETQPNSDGQLEPRRAVKQYSRSSADQEIPMCYELRPASVLMSTCAYLLHEIADTDRMVSSADWFHFMWDRFRGIRKDIAQQALCCSESIQLVEMCARFHAHCAASLADLEHTQFDQKLNTDNLTKCLQTLKHMYADVGPEQKPREAEFRGYVALLNLGDANFWWEIKQLPEAIQKSAPIIFAIKVFNALDNNNYVRFFRLVQQDATYLQACILLRYFNDVRARALARIVKAYAPRGGSRFPAEDLIKCLAFESIDNMKTFINHYGLRFAKTDDSEPAIILDRHQFIEDSDPYPVSRSIDLIESKRQCSVGHVIAGGELPNNVFHNHTPYSSFSRDGKLKDTALIAEDQTYNTKNDSNKDINNLKNELRRFAQGGKTFTNVERVPEPTTNSFMKPDSRLLSPGKSIHTFSASSNAPGVAKFSFKPAIAVAPIEAINDSPKKAFPNDLENVFSFSKPQASFESNLSRDIFKANVAPESRNMFGTLLDENKDPFKNSLDGKINKPASPDAAKSSFGKSYNKAMTDVANKNVFGRSNAEVPAKNIFASFNSEPRTEVKGKNIFGKFSSEAKTEPSKVFGEISVANKNEVVGKSVFGQLNSDTSKNVFGQFSSEEKTDELNKNIFGKNSTNKNIFSKATENPTGPQKTFGNSIFANAKENNLFSKPDGQASLDKGGNFFAKSTVENDIKPTPNIFGAFNKSNAFTETSNLFTKAVNSNEQISQNTVFSLNGDTKLSPGSLFKSATAPVSTLDTDKPYSIFQSKNKAQSVADNILNSLNAPINNNVYDFEDSNDAQKQLELQRINEQKIREEQKKIQERMRQEEENRLELKRQEERRKEEERKNQEELKRLEQKRKKEEEERKQEELKKKLEEEKQAELKRKAEEERKFKERVDKESIELVEELLVEVQDETIREILRDEIENLKNLVAYANKVTDELLNEMCNEICLAEMKAEKFVTDKVMKKWFHVWKKNLIRNVKRRTLLEDTPVWLTERTPIDEASHLRRRIEKAVLKNMNDVHRGYRFTGELKQLPIPEPYNILDIIRSPLLKRMKQIKYPYDKCFFWKVALISPTPMKWFYRKLDIEKWLLDVFSDKKKHQSESLIHVGKYTWNHLMDFAISVSMANKVNNNFYEALEGANALAFYTTEKDHEILDVIKETLKHKYPYQTVPITVIMPKMEDSSIHNELECLLTSYINNKTISAFKIFIVDSQCISESLNMCTKSALKWMAKKYPTAPPLEIDYLKSLCQRYLGNEIWCRLKSETDSRVNVVQRDLLKLIKCYNIAVDKLTGVLTNEDLFNYPSFPLEFKNYLDSTSPYPKPYEFISSNVQTSENVTAIKELISQLKLPEPVSGFRPIDVSSMQNQIRKYCKQIGCFENPEEVVCKVVAILPQELSCVDMPHEQFRENFENYDLLDVLNVIVYEKINSLKNFDNRFAIYTKSELEEYRNMHWIYEIEVLSNLKHKAIEYDEDNLDKYIEAKRRRIALDSMEYLMLEDNDCTLVEDNIKITTKTINEYSHCTEAVKQLEKQLDVEKQKSIEFENLLKAALSNV